jgi:ABC-2 type transport system permease protein
MSASTLTTPPVTSQLRRIGAFLERDFRLAWSYRVAFFSDAASVFGQAFLFVFVGRMVDPATLPSFGGRPVTYLGFVTVGLAITSFLGVGQRRLQAMIGTERYLGTLEAVILTPVRLTTLQLGWLSYDLLYVPIRTAVFFVVMALAFGVDLDPSGALPTAAVILIFLPFVWGLGAASAAATLVFRHGGFLGGASSFVLMFTSGAYFPLDLLPRWIAWPAQFNPVTIAVEGARSALLGGATMSGIAGDLVVLACWAATTLFVGLQLFQRAFRRELATGNIGLY